jgi:hypothetical protein
MEKITFKRVFSLTIIVVLVTIAFTGLLEPRAYDFVSHVLKNNLEFLAAIESLQLIISGISTIDVPFISGHTTQLSQSLGKGETFLLTTSAISFIQLMFVSITKSWITKSVLLILLGLSLIKSIRIHCLKLLVIALALNPGILIYSVVIKEVSKHASIDFGDKYLVELKSNVEAIKAEKKMLMQEHAKTLTEIRNNEKGIELFRKLKEDISYDFQKIRVDVSGDYQQIRLLIHDAGYIVISKIYGFCSMILFSMFIMPIGYLVFIYFIYNITFNKYGFYPEFINKLDRVLIPNGAPIKNVEAEAIITNTKLDTQHLKKENIDNNINNVVGDSHKSNIINDLENSSKVELNKVVEGFKDLGSHINLKSTISDELKKLSEESVVRFKEFISNERNQLHSHMQNEISKHIEHVKVHLLDFIESDKELYENSINALKVKHKNELEDTLRTLEQQLKTRTASLISKIESQNISNTTSDKILSEQPIKKAILTM